LFKYNLTFNVIIIVDSNSSSFDAFNNYLKTKIRFDQSFKFRSNLCLIQQTKPETDIKHIVSYINTNSFIVNNQLYYSNIQLNDKIIKPLSDLHVLLGNIKNIKFTFMNDIKYLFNYQTLFRTKNLHIVVPQTLYNQQYLFMINRFAVATKTEHLILEFQNVNDVFKLGNYLFPIYGDVTDHVEFMKMVLHYCAPKKLSIISEYGCRPNKLEFLLNYNIDEINLSKIGPCMCLLDFEKICTCYNWVHKNPKTLVIKPDNVE
jgi:hypothetical protein